ncbi:UNVERIFIED_CONTAM: hypothetical protein HDU68_005236 [Siphonaria sp. JEL0065]|nr:hypothetical protein HDU68_005236 [Siphonaria sp. JEL0065]
MSEPGPKHSRNAFEDDSWETNDVSLLAPAATTSSSAMNTSANASVLASNSGTSLFATAFEPTSQQPFVFQPQIKIMRRSNQQQTSETQLEPAKRNDSTASSSTSTTKSESPCIESHSNPNSRLNSCSTTEKSKDEQYREAKKRLGLDSLDDDNNTSEDVDKVSRVLADVAILDNPVFERLNDPEYRRGRVTPPEYQRGVYPGVGVGVVGYDYATVAFVASTPPPQPIDYNNPNLHTFAQLQAQYQAKKLHEQQQQQQGQYPSNNGYQPLTRPNPGQGSPTSTFIPQYQQPLYNPQQQYEQQTQQPPTFNHSKRYSSHRSGSSTSSVGSEHQQYQHPSLYYHQQQPVYQQQQLYNPGYQQYQQQNQQQQQQQPQLQKQNYGASQQPAQFQQSQQPQSPPIVDLSSNAFPPLRGGAGGGGKKTPTKSHSKPPKSGAVAVVGGNGNNSTPIKNEYRGSQKG